jgi:hypothetical protein
VAVKVQQVSVLAAFVIMQGVTTKVIQLRELLPSLTFQAKGQVSVLTAFVNTQGITTKVIQLRELLPSLNISRLVAQHPAFVLNYDHAYLASKLEYLRRVPH